MSIDSLPAPEAIWAGALVWVDLVDGPELRQTSPARVLETDGEQLWISAPEYDPSTPAVREGSPVTVRWTGERGIYLCPALLAAAATQTAEPWRVRLTGAVETLQRREYARASFGGPVALVPMGDGPVAVLQGELTDLSEGGLRANVHGAPLTAGTPVEVHLELDATPVTLPGQVLRSDAADDAGIFETVVTFAVREVHASQLRRVVLRQQMLARRDRLR